MKKKQKNIPITQLLNYSITKAFTLIEILIVTVIIIVFSGLSLAYYNNLTEQQKLRNEARKLVDVLELAKKKASSGDLSGRTCNGGFNGYEININASNYSMYLWCGGNRLLPAINNYSISNSNISIYQGTGQYFFKPLTTLSTGGTIRFKNNSISQCLSIIISTAGIIDLDDNFSPC